MRLLPSDDVGDWGPEMFSSKDHLLCACIVRDTAGAGAEAGHDEGIDARKTADGGDAVPAVHLDEDGPHGVVDEIEVPGDEVGNAHSGHDGERARVVLVVSRAGDSAGEGHDGACAWGSVAAPDIAEVGLNVVGEGGVVAFGGPEGARKVVIEPFSIEGDGDMYVNGTGGYHHTTSSTAMGLEMKV